MKTEPKPKGKKSKLPSLENKSVKSDIKAFFQKLWEYLKRDETIRRLLGIGTTLIMCVIFLGSVYEERLNLNVGDVVTRDIVATHEVLDYTAWEEIQREVERSVSKTASEDLSNYRVEKAYLFSAEEDFQEIIQIISDNRTEEDAKARDIGMVQNLIKTQTKLDVSPTVIKNLLQISEEDLNLLRTMGLETISQVMAEGVSTTTLPDAKEKVAQLFLTADVDLGFEVLTSASEVVQAVIRPNLQLDSDKVNKLIKDAVEEARASAPTIKKGQIIVREGDVLTSKDLMILDALNMVKRSWNWQRALGIVTVTLLIAGVFYYYLYSFYRNLENKYFVLYCTIILVVAVLGKLLTLIDWPYAIYFFPASAATMLLTLLVNPTIGVFTAVLYSLMTAFFAEFAIPPVLMSLFGAVVGVYCVKGATQRGSLMQAGLLVGVTNALSMIACGLILQETSLMVMSFVGLINGIVSAVLTIGLLPYLELIFDVASPMRLLELSNPNNPLLRRLSLEAPGTYHHSIVVGNLAEAAAEAIGADPLLTRVGALYHDIGKLARPYFFVENQRGENPHNKMSPNLSRMVILNHVKEGLELAKEHKLPKIITDFIVEHHGTSTVQHFYEKAKETDQNPVLLEDFSYPGPKPQSKETAILMLADSAEAAVRSMTQPTYDKIQSMIKSIAKAKLNDGQLSRSTLTLREIEVITEVMSRQAAGIHHSRLKYPGQKL